MIIVPTNVTAPAVPPVYQRWTYLQQPAVTGGYTTMTMPTHSAGDIILSYLGGFGDPVNNPGGANPPAAGGTVPTWTLATSSGVGAVWWARATSSTHTSGSWYTASGWLHSMSVISGARATGSPIGGSVSHSASAIGNDFTVPALTMTNTNGSSLLITLFFAQNVGTQSGVPTMTNPTTGYTRRDSTAWIAPNNMGLYGGVITKDDSTSDGAFTGGGDGGNFPFTVTVPCQLEILSP